MTSQPCSRTSQARIELESTPPLKHRTARFAVNNTLLTFSIRSCTASDPAAINGFLGRCTLREIPPNSAGSRLMQQFASLELSLNQGSLAQRLDQLLDTSSAESSELPFSLD